MQFYVFFFLFCETVIMSLIKQYSLNEIFIGNFLAANNFLRKVIFLYSILSFSGEKGRK